MGKIGRVQEVTIDLLRPYERNAKIHTEKQVEQIARSIEEFGFLNPCLIDKEYNIIAGHGRVLAAKKLGFEKVPCVYIEGLTDEQRRAYILADNRLTELGEWDDEIVKMELETLSDEGFDISVTGFDLDDYEENPYAEKADNLSLAERFIVPPFSVLNTREGYWQDRKKSWLDLGIKSEVGREENLLGFSEIANYLAGLTGTSIFDPVLCEIMYKWYCTENGSIFDCFAGGSVRGIVAERLGYHYTGIELRSEQVEANKQNAEEIGLNPTWICDDSLNADKYVADDSVDMIFTCPPYADLEVYSNDERDISNMSYEDFSRIYSDIMSIAIRKLKENRFGVVVISDVRDKKGFYRDLVGLTKSIFVNSGAKLYNEYILVNSVGSGAIRAPRQFANYRKSVKVHQNVLVFYKGENPKLIKDIFPEVSVEDLDGDDDD